MSFLNRTALGSTRASRLDPRVKPGGDKKTVKVKTLWAWY